MLIYANKLENDAADLNFFFHQRKRNDYLGNFKNFQPKILRRKNARAEKWNVGYRGTPLTQLSVNLKCVTNAQPIPLYLSLFTGTTL